MQRISSSKFPETVLSSVHTIKAMLAVFALACMTLLAPATSSADTVQPKAAFPSIQLPSHEQGEAAIRALGATLPRCRKVVSQDTEGV